MEGSSKTLTEMREKFYSIILQENLKPNSQVLKKEKYWSLIEDVKRIKSTNKKEFTKDYRIIKRYDVLSLQGAERLIKPLQNDSQEVKLYVFAEEIFDILHATHLSIGHGGRDRMIKELHKRYGNITQFQINTFLGLCDSCEKKKKGEKSRYIAKPLTFSHFNSRCQVDLIDYQSKPDGDYKFLLVYQDYLTKFVILKPLRSKEPGEVANYLLDIFLLIGAPVIMQSDSGRDFCSSVIEKLKSLWPELKMVHGWSMHNQNQDVQNMLTTWMSDNATEKWSEGARFVQFMKNRAYHSGIRRSPYEAMFGCTARVGLSSSFIPQDVLQNIKTEEDIADMCNYKNSSESDAMHHKEPEIHIQILDNKPICIVCSQETTDARVCSGCNMNVHISCGVIQEDEWIGKKVLCNVCCNKSDEESQLDEGETDEEVETKKIKIESDL